MCYSGSCHWEYPSGKCGAPRNASCPGDNEDDKYEAKRDAYYDHLDDLKRERKLEGRR